MKRSYRKLQVYQWSVSSTMRNTSSISARHSRKVHLDERVVVSTVYISHLWTAGINLLPTKERVMRRWCTKGKGKVNRWQVMNHLSFGLLLQSSAVNRLNACWRLFQSPATESKTERKRISYTICNLTCWSWGLLRYGWIPASIGDSFGSCLFKC